MGGNASNTNHIELNVATLNYSGIIKSPYQFYQFAQLDHKDYKSQNQTQQVQLNKIMQSIEFEKINKNDDKNKMIKQEQGKEQIKELTKEQRQEVRKQMKKKYDCGPLDLKWQQDRYSPLYVPTCGIKNKIHLMNQKQFRNEWEVWKKRSQDRLGQIYNNWKKKTNEIVKQIRKIHQNHPQEIQKKLKEKFNQYIRNIQNFDFLIYQVILKQFYKSQQQKKQLNTNFHIIPQKDNEFHMDAKKYKQNRKRKFNKSFLHESSRINKIIDLLQKLDIDLFFLQEVTGVFVQQIQRRLKNIRIVKSCKPNSKQLLSQSVILIRQNQTKFPKLRSLLQQNSRFTNNIVNLDSSDAKPRYLAESQIEQLNFNKDTVIQFLYNIILICPHLTSKSNQNPAQINLLRQKLAFLRRNFPECHVILAGDLNCTSLLTKTIQTKSASSTSQRQKSQGNKTYQYNVVPMHDSQVTTNKKRTLLQAQIDKADQPAKGVKDYIISDLLIKDSKGMIAKDQQVLFNCDDGQLKTNQKLPFLPSDDHPFDHFLVFGKVIVENMVHVTDFQYRYKYNPKALTQQEVKKLQQHKKNTLEQPIHEQ